MKKIAVYTCITGNYDNLMEVRTPEKQVDYYCFTNNRTITSNTWKVVYIDNDGLDDHRLSRKIKMLGHPIINEHYEISVWMDVSVSFIKSIYQFVEQFGQMDRYPFAACVHHSRDCIYEEAKTCVKYRKDKKDIIKKQMEFYKKEGFPAHYGLYEMTVFIKKHNEPVVKKTMKMWFDMVCKWSRRDQLSFMWCIYQTHMPIAEIPLNIFDNEWFYWYPHHSVPAIKECRVYCGTNQEDEKQYNWDYDLSVPYLHLSEQKVQIQFSVVRTISDIKLDLMLPASTKVFNIVTNYSYEMFHFEEIDNCFYATSSSYIMLHGNFKKGTTIDVQLSVDLYQGDYFMKKYIEKEQDNRLLLEKNQKLTQKNNELDQELCRLLNSKSWMVTKPLRKISKILKK